MTRQPAPLFDPDRGEVPADDFVEIYASDALLDDAGSGSRHKRVDPFADMLARMRAAADDEPHPELFDVATAQAILATARRRYRAQRRNEWLVLAAAVVFAAGGVWLLFWVG